MKILWAYAYKIVTLQPWSRLGTIRTLLSDEAAAARDCGHTWVGRLVLEPDATRILAVGDSLEQNREVNRRLEAQLKNVGAAFSVTASMAVLA